MKRLITLACLLFIAISSFAQTCTISGKVVNKEGKALEMATVIIKELQKAVNTNIDGTFSFEAIKMGKYTIIVDYLGYNTFEKEFKTKDNNTIFNIILESKNIITEDIIVKATRAGSKTPMAFTNMNKEELSKLDNGKDITFLLSSLPSIVATSESGTGIGNTAIRVRGTDPTRINVCVNGIPMNDSESQAVFWANMPDFASSVNNVQVQRGVGSSTNGAAAFGATVNFQTTKIDEKAYANINFAGGSFNSFIKNIKLGTGRIGKHFSFDAKYSELKSDGYVKYASADHKSAFLSASYIADKTLIKANIILGEQHTGISWWGTPKEKLDSDRRYNPAGVNIDNEAKEHYYKEQTDNYWQNHYQLIINHFFNDSFKANIALHTTTGNGYYEQYKDKENYFADESMSFIYYGLKNPIINGIEQETTDVIRRKQMDNIFYGITSSFIYEKNNLNIVFGGAINKYDGEHFGRVLWTEYSDGNMPKNHEWYRNSSEKIDGNIFAKANYLLTDNLNVYGDIQYRYIDYKMEGLDDDNLNIDQRHYYNFINPKCGLSYSFNNNSKLYASFAIGNREPSRTDLKDASKNDASDFPRKETLFDYEAGYSFNNEKLSAAANIYYMDYKDQLVNTGKLSSNGYAIMTNVESSYRTGIELSASYKFNEILKYSANTTISSNIINDYKDIVKTYNSDWSKIKDINGKQIRETISYGDSQISYSPSFIASSIIEISPIKNIKLGLISKYVGKQYFDNTENNDRSIDAYFVNDINIDYNFKLDNIKSINLQLALNNVLEEQYESNAYGGYDLVGGEQSTWANYFTQAGFNFMIKASINF